MERKRKGCIAAICVLLLVIAVTSCLNTQEKYVNGIDVSYYQGNIDAQQVKTDVVVIRMGYSGYENPDCKLDISYKDNVEKFMTTDIKIALYWVSHAVSVEEVEQENHFIQEKYNSLSKEAKKRITHIFIDREKISNSDYDAENPVDGVSQFIGRADYLSNEEFNTVLCEQVSQLQKLLPDLKVGVYTNVEYLVNIIDTKKLGDIPIWIAWWNYEGDVESFEPVVERVAEDSANAAAYLIKNIVMWQYSDRGEVEGIEEKVDLILVSSDMFE